MNCILAFSLLVFSRITTIFFPFFFVHFIGHSSPEFTVENAFSYYSIKHFGCQDFYHVTPCFSPRSRYLAGLPYYKSATIEKALREITQLSITGLVVTKDTFSARVSLTQKQQQLWKNDNDQSGLQKWKRGTVFKIGNDS